VKRTAVCLAVVAVLALPATVIAADTMTIAPMMSIPVLGRAPTGGPAETEEVVFRVTLEGPVDPSHTFAVDRHCVEERCVVEDAEVICSPPELMTFGNGACSAGTYEFTIRVQAGLTVEYSLRRWTTPDLSRTADQPEEYLNGSWVVRDGRQVISLGFDYLGGALPDTALPAP
jgi:hypothetical protein